MSTSTHNWNTIYGVVRGNHAIDRVTDTVFFSDLLPRRCPMLYEKLHDILYNNSIDHRLLSNTKDIWCRDYMPIQTDWNRFVFYKYNPDYLQKPHLIKTITDVNQVGHIDTLREGEVVDLDLVIDGGNIVKCDDKIIMTEKVFFENKDKSHKEVVRLLEEAFQCGIVFLPWDRDEFMGHSDGIVHYIGDNRVMMTNYADFNAAMSRRFIKAMDNYVDIVQLEYNVKRRHERSWAYINFLQIGSLVLVPQLGIPEDEQALQQISDAMPKCKVIGVPALEAVRKGGALNCISWNVSTNWWHNGFMGEEYKVHDRPVSWIKKAAEKGMSNWQCNLGSCYFYGKGVEKDMAEGNKWYLKSSEQGSGKACFNLGLSYFRGEGLLQDYAEAKRCFEKSAEKGDADAQLFVAYCLEEQQASDEEIVAAYRKAAEMGNTDAQCFLGDCYCDGKNGLPKNKKEAYRWYHEAAEQGDAEGQYQVGQMYEYGVAVKKSMKEAARWYRRAASKKHTRATCQLGYCYFYGEGLRMNDKWALRCFRKAVIEGDKEAMYMIGEHYFYGYAVEDDYSEAFNWYKKSAAKNYIPAIYRMGYCFYHGMGVEMDMVKAFSYFQQAAEADYAKAICMIGEYYYYGIVVERDQDKAIEYYMKSCELGYRHAFERVRDILLQKMKDYDDVPY